MSLTKMQPRKNAKPVWQNLKESNLFVSFYRGGSYRPHHEHCGPPLHWLLGWPISK